MSDLSDMATRRTLMVALVMSLQARLVYPHVSLLYPPARTLDLDFLDNSRTVGDCGMEKGDIKTNLQAGGSLNLTWSLGYPHPGGYRLTLVNPTTSNQKVLIPTSGSDWETAQGKYAQSHQLQLPSESCDDCYLRFERQATNWGANYIFRSCADISLSSSPVGDFCSGRGTSQGGVCSCQQGYLGHKCQYKTECQSDLDCNGPKGQGTCVTLDNSVYKDSKCFCSPGFYGAQCDKKSRWNADRAQAFNKGDFTEVKLGKGGTESLLYWRVEDDGDIEIVYEAPTTSWVGLGWKPSDLAWPACQSFPETVPAPKRVDPKQMDCTDMVIGRARGNQGSVADYYSRDRSTPREDSFWGGEDDLTSAHAWEAEGKTFMRFTKKVGGGTGDHPLTGKLTLIWAYGGWDQGKQDDAFYQDDQLKFHGHSRDRIGVSTLDLGDLGSGSFSAFTGENGNVHIAILVSVVLFVAMMGFQVFINFQRGKKKPVAESRQYLHQ